MSNLSPDWGNYYGTCTDCGGSYHASGTVQCDCKECERCEKPKAPDDLEEGTCLGCLEMGDVCCPACKEWAFKEHMEGGVCPDCIETLEGESDENEGESRPRA